MYRGKSRCSRLFTHKEKGENENPHRKSVESCCCCRASNDPKFIQISSTRPGQSGATRDERVQPLYENYKKDRLAT